MLACHLDGEIDLSSRNTDWIDRSADWIISQFKISPGTKIADFGCGPGLYTTRLALLEECKTPTPRRCLGLLPSEIKCACRQ
jgi:hypothetical protein